MSEFKFIIVQIIITRNLIRKLIDFFGFCPQIVFFRLNKVDIPVDVTATIRCKLGQKQRIINIEGVTGLEQPAFKHSGNTIIFEVPSAYCSST